MTKWDTHHRLPKDVASNNLRGRCASERLLQCRLAILLPDLRYGGAERVSIYLANEFVSRGFTVDVVLMEAAGDLLPLLNPAVGVIDLGVARMRGLFGPLASYLRTARPAALVSNMWPLTACAVAAARWVARRHGTRVVVVEHNNWTLQSRQDSPLLRTLRKISMRLLFPLAAGRVGVSRGVALDLERHAYLASGSVQCIYNPVTGVQRGAVQISDGATIQAWANGTHQKLLAVGVLQPQKRFDWLLEAFSRLEPDGQARLLILGDGPERAMLEAMVTKLGLENRVSMPGFVDNPAAYYAHADLFVLSSEYEGLSLVLVEALEQGTPVVAMDCPSGPREVLENGKFGALVPVGDVEALAAAMQKALNEPHDREALKRRAQDFSVDKAAVAYLDLLLPGWRSFPVTEAQPAAIQPMPNQ